MALTRRRRRRSQSEKITYLLLLAPAAVVLVTTTVYPILNSLWISFRSWNPMSPTRTSDFVGVENYLDLLGAPYFRASIVRTIVFVAASVSIELILGFGVALVLVSSLRAVGIIRTAVIAPLVTTPVVVGILWGQLLNTEYGPVNYFLDRVGLPRQQLLADPDTAMIGVILVQVWQYMPVTALILAAGLLSRPAEVMEAARVDGATGLQSLWYVTLPLMRPAFATALVIRVVDAFKIFDVILVLTQGGPIKATKVVSMYIYEDGLKFFELGRASAMSWIFLVLVGAVSFPLVRRFFRSVRR